MRVYQSLMLCKFVRKLWGGVMSFPQKTRGLKFLAAQPLSVATVGDGGAVRLGQ
jgi:hypothetical protein